MTKLGKFVKIWSTFCQIYNDLSNIAKHLIKFCQSDQISPNLVALIDIDQDMLAPDAHPLQTSQMK